MTATLAARRPNTWSLASTRCQLALSSPFLARYVLVSVLIVGSLRLYLVQKAPQSAQRLSVENGKVYRPPGDCQAFGRPSEPEKAQGPKKSREARTAPGGRTYKMR